MEGSESQGQRFRSAGDGVIWGALLLQAEANLALSQSLLRCTQSVFDKEVTVDLEPDRLESWYAARGDAAIGCDIAEHVTQQAQNIIGPGEQRGKCAIGSKRRVPSVLELLKGEGSTPAANCKIIDDCSGEGGRKPCIIQGFGSSDVVPTSQGAKAAAEAKEVASVQTAAVAKVAANVEADVEVKAAAEASAAAGTQASAVEKAVLESKAIAGAKAAAEAKTAAEGRRADTPDSDGPERCVEDHVERREQAPWTGGGRGKLSRAHRRRDCKKGTGAGSTEGPEEGQEPSPRSGSAKGKPGLINTLKQAGLDSRGELQAPLAHESGKDSGAIGSGHEGREVTGTSPTRVHGHDPFVYGDLKKWLDGLQADIDRAEIDCAVWLEGNKDGPVLSELASWLRRVGKGGKARFTEVTVALQKEGYGDLWLMLMTSDEAREACRQMVP